MSNVKNQTNEKPLEVGQMVAIKGNVSCFQNGKEFSGFCRISDVKSKEYTLETLEGVKIWNGSFPTFPKSFIFIP